MFSCVEDGGECPWVGIDEPGATADAVRQIPSLEPAVTGRLDLGPPAYQPPGRSGISHV